VTEPVYATPAAFKQALEQRLRTAASIERVDLARRRQLLVFDRFLARVFAQLGERVCLKGGLVLELRLERARTTKDVDLRCIGEPERIVEELRAAGRLHLGDFMTFELARHSQHPVIHNDGMKYDGLRLRAECRLAGKLYGQPFGVDVAFDDPLTEPGDVIVAHDSLAFASVSPPRFVVYPIETQIAEKLHAYTMPRARPNTRVKDLPDIALLATARELDASRVRAALERTFEYRATHPVPVSVPEPPAEWSPIYEALAREDRLPWASLDEVHGAVRAFLDPLLANGASVTWSPQSWHWSTDALSS
jgi:predicted nucleotidyltransferase component of viral defense system